MIDLDQAKQLLWREARPTEEVGVDLETAHGRVLRQEVRADRDFPPTDRSAMDGFAVRAADLAGGSTVLEVVGESRAGSSTGDLRVGAGQAVKIMTGAVLPEGADAVVMVERTRPADLPGRVTVLDRPAAGQHIRPRGQDLVEGETVLEPGVVIHAAEIAALASVGASKVSVSRAPVVHVLATGDEIVEPDRTPEPHQIRNSNSPSLMAQLREMGIDGTYVGIAPDDREGLREKLRAGLEGDCLLISGGVSVGEYDLVGEILEEEGMRLLFHKVAIKPGKPILAGRRGDCLVIGLPGNPVSTYVGFAVFVAPLLRRMMACRNWANVEVRARLEAPLAAKAGRVAYHLARVRSREDGLAVTRTHTTGSGDVLSLVHANSLMITPAEGADLPAGASVTALLWRDFQLR